MNAFEHAFEQVQQLVNTFQQNYHHYMSAGYSESAARTDFIDKFFTALGWDVNHTIQTNPYEQEVKIEKSQSQQNESARKRADYAFYTAPNFKDEVFFCEAKKPSVLISQNPQHYFQTIKYGWNSGCPISVLTDFEELVVIDCRNKPDLKFALNGKHKTYRFTDYADKEKFGEIYWLFSREAVGNNSLQKYAEQLPKVKGKAVQKSLFKGGYQAIDDSFLEYIDGIRENIAKAFKKSNPELNSEQLTEATQRTVDRLVFIRFLEDKFIEAAEHVSEWQSWKDFITDCRKLDAKYNGVVFKKHFIDEPDFIGADEKLFLDICSDISNLNSPYDFNYIPIHILGSIYERFLGKIVIATDKRVRIEEKPEVRKAGGVYYTPKYIVDYIVKNTVGKIIEGLTPKQISEKRFADIACGSGSFLIGVYDYLLDYHKKYYVEKLKDKTEIDGRSEDFGNVEYKDGQWMLTLKLKQDILLNNIYGVDIDAQAVEVTQLSLFLKMLEEENVSSTQIKQGALFSKVLPDLSKNIICGNSLIGWDIMNGQLFEDDELKKLNPMDYDASFPKIIRKGGFDAIVGNPPYSLIGSDRKREQSYFTSGLYNLTAYKINTYVLFLEKGLNLLQSSQGKLGLIIPKSLVFNTYFDSTRNKLLQTYSIPEIVEIKEKVFADAEVGDSILFFGSKSSQPQENELEYIKVTNIFPDFQVIASFKSKQEDLLLNHDSKFFPSILSIKTPTSRLDEVCNVYNGLNTGNVKHILLSDVKQNENYKRMLLGRDIQRYNLLWSGTWINYDNSLKEKLKPSDIKSKEGMTAQNKVDFALRDKKIYLGPKILIRKTADHIIASFDNEDYYYDSLSYGVLLKEGIKISIFFILGLLNSKLVNLLHENLADNKEKVFAKVLATNISKLPIPKIDLKATLQKQLHDTLVNLVNQMLESKKELSSAKTDSNKNFLQNKCASLDRQIDNLVYELYGLTEEEIKIIEGN